jgi:predicted acetyltransferase
MELIPPSAEFKDPFIGAVKEFQADTEYPLMHKRYHELSIEGLEKNFDAFVEEEISHARGENLLPGYVPQTDYWLVDGDAFIGRVSIRHRLNEHLEQVGGHIGYDIRPSKRKQGYGSKILELALPKAKELGIKRVLLTCDETNTASRRIIEKNGGILENQVSNPETGVDKLRFWIDIQ